MGTKGRFDFDFDFGQDSRSALLGSASKTIGALRSELSEGAEAVESDDERSARKLLADLDSEVAEFASFPEIVPLKAEQFELHGLKPPARFVDLSRDHRFYWVRFPITLRPLADRPFVKLQCAVEFNPGASPGHLRPVAQMILPDRRFQTLLQAHTSVTLGIGEDFEFKARGAGDAAATPDIAASIVAAVDAKAAASADMTAGPFAYTLKRAKIDHSGTGTEKVFWSLDGAEFFEEEEPVLVVVLRVPNEVVELHISAALQAKHEFRLLAASLGGALTYFRERVSTFFKAGAPVTHTRAWDLTPRL